MREEERVGGEGEGEKQPKHNLCSHLSLSPPTQPFNRSIPACTAP